MNCIQPLYLRPALRAAAFFATALVPLAGCDLTGQYEARFQQSLQTANLRATFDQLLFPTEIDLTDANRQSVGVKIRLPTYFDASSKPLPPTEARAQPPFVKLPNLSFAYERALNDSAEKFLPVYLYIAAVPKAEMKADALQAALAQQVSAALPGAAWSDVKVQSPTGAELTLKRLRGEGSQDFVNLQTNAVEKQEGRFDLYFIDAPGHHVLLGWRAAKGQGDKWQFAASDAAMGTIAVSEAPAAGGAPAAPSGCAFAPAMNPLLAFSPCLAPLAGPVKLGELAVLRANRSQHARVAGFGSAFANRFVLRRDSSVG